MCLPCGPGGKLPTEGIVGNDRETGGTGQVCASLPSGTCLFFDYQVDQVMVVPFFLKSCRPVNLA